LRWKVRMLVATQNPINLKPVLWIPIGFNADLDPAFYLNADPDPDLYPGGQTNVEPDPDLDPSHKKLNFYMKNVLQVISQQTYLRWYKSLFETQETRFICEFSAAGLIPSASSVLPTPNQSTPHSQCCGSGSGIRCLFDPWIRDPE
jgi:hypothetical protein